MKIKNIFIRLVLLLACIFDVENNEYCKLEKSSNLSIKREKLPKEFSDEAYMTIVDFIQKTRGLDYEWVIYFDYITGEILKSSSGEGNNVKMDIEKGEFEGHLVASIHNHPKDVYSPPSDNNFGILARDFEDYELVAGFEHFWILKAKGNYGNLIHEVKFVSKLLFRAAFENSKLLYDDWDEINDECDKAYGNQLSNYINDKNINDIQLFKLEYAVMSANSNNSLAQYNCLKRIYDPEEFRKADERNANPNILTGKDAVYALYQLMGMEIEYDAIFEDP